MNKAWEMPARPRVTNGLSETCTCYHEEKKKKNIKNARTENIVRMHPALVPITYLHIGIDGEI